MSYKYQFGYPYSERKERILEAVRNNNNQKEFRLFYRGSYRMLPIVDVPIELLIYRVENIRTKNLQKEWLARHKDLPSNLFSKENDTSSIEVQENQHDVLRLVVDKENLFKTFEKDNKNEQTDPLICTNDGVVVNGNRRLCTWRELYYRDKIRYSHFQTVSVAVLPDNDEQGIYDLEIRLQVTPDMKADYTWHAIAADCQEKIEAGMDITDIAKKQGKKPQEIKACIECYEYAEKHLESIGHPNEWSKVDKQEFAFKQIVNERKKIDNQGDKDLFLEISKALLQSPAKGDRLYKQIPTVASNLPIIADKLKNAFSITISDSSNDSDDVDILIGGDTTEQNETNAQIATAIRVADEPMRVTKVVTETLNTIEHLEQEKKKKSFIFDEVKKAATCLSNAIQSIDDVMDKDGVKNQLENIKTCCNVLQNWVDQ